MARLYIIIGLLILSVLLGLGALWQRDKYVTLSKQFEELVEANKGLAEASEKQGKVLTLVGKDMQQGIAQANEALVQTQADIATLNQIKNQGNANERAVMSASLPSAVVGVLDDAYEDRGKAGIDP